MQVKMKIGLLVVPVLFASFNLIDVTYACGTSAIYFDGGVVFNVNGLASGAEANISPDNPYVGCTSSSAWAMLANGESGGGYAQTGYLKFPSFSTPQVFTEWHDWGSTDDQVLYPQYGWDNSTHNYGVYDNTPTGANGGQIVFTYAGNQLGTVWWNNVFNSSHPADSLQYDGEIHDTGDQIVGTSSNHVTFSYVEYQDYNTGNWTLAPIPSSGWSTGDSTSRLYNTNYSTNWQFQIWDTAVMAQ